MVQPERLNQVPDAVPAGKATNNSGGNQPENFSLPPAFEVTPFFTVFLISFSCFGHSLFQTATSSIPFCITICNLRIADLCLNLCKIHSVN